MDIQHELREALARLKLGGRPVCCHHSMRSYSHPFDPALFVAACLDAGITLMVPTFTYGYELLPADVKRPARNGLEHDVVEAARWPGAFDPRENRLSRTEMGALARAVLACSGRHRGNHALNSFSAVGPLAEALVADQSPEDVYAPFVRLEEFDGAVLMAGTDATSLTWLHEVERRAGRQLFVRWAWREGRIVPHRVGSCSSGFNAFMPWIDRHALTTLCDGSPWRALSVRNLGPLTDMVRDQPTITRCKNPACNRCKDAISGGPLA